MKCHKINTTRRYTRTATALRFARSSVHFGLSAAGERLIVRMVRETWQEVKLRQGVKMNFLEQYRLHKTFSKYVSKDVLDDLLSGKVTDEDFRTLKDGQIEFVLIAVRGETPQIISERMGKIAAIACQHNGIIDSLVSSLVIVVWGMIEFDTKQQGDRFTLIEALNKTFGDNIKVVHGSENGCFGNLGSDTRMSFSFIVPSFINALGLLANLPYGETKQVRNVPTPA
jgi:hypothetical protein